MNKILLFIILLFPTQVLAYGLATSHTNFYFKFGGNMDTSYLWTNKIAALGYQHKLKGLFDYQLEGGYFVDNMQSTAFRTVYASTSAGMSIVKPSYYISTFLGPALVTATDNHLSSPLEFSIDIEAGILDHGETGIGLGYKHFSNPLTSPNLGRDFLFFKVRIP